MSQPWLSIIAPTIGRDTLERLLRSVRWQAPAAEVELVIVGDTFGDQWAGALAPVPALCAQYDARYLPYDGGQHMVGHPQRTYGQQHATGEWLLWSQDDNLYEAGALAAVRDAALMRRSPHLFRVRTRFGFVVWQVPLLSEGNIDADCLLVPNDPARLGTWALRYAGDYDMIRETCDRWDGTQRWADAVIARGRPAAADDWTRAV